jgi:hypothetical protein
MAVSCLTMKSSVPTSRRFQGVPLGDDCSSVRKLSTACERDCGRLRTINTAMLSFRRRELSFRDGSRAKRLEELLETEPHGNAKMPMALKTSRNGKEDLQGDTWRHVSNTTTDRETAADYTPRLPNHRKQR